MASASLDQLPLLEEDERMDSQVRLMGSEEIA